MASSIYKKIPGVGTGRGGFQIASRSRLYQAPDHLLILQSTGYTEEYKRLFFRDIRAVEVRDSQGQIWRAVVSAVITVLLALTYFVYVPWGLVVVFCFPFVIWFIANLVWGPMCVCYISTNIQTLKIPAPQRRKKLDAFIQFLNGRIATSDSVGTPQPGT